MANQKRSITIAGHRTSISLEPIFWTQLKSIAEAENLSLAALIQKIDSQRKGSNLSSAIRVFVLERILLDSRVPAEAGTQ